MIFIHLVFDLSIIVILKDFDNFLFLIIKLRLLDSANNK